MQTNIENKSLPFVSVVIAVKDEQNYLENCINSLLNQTYEKDMFEILVYDGLSTDGTWEYLQKMSENYSQIRIFKNERITAAAGWNEGFKISQAKYVVMMGAHTEVASDFLEKNIEILEKENAPCAGGRVTAIGEDIKSQAIALAFNHPFGVGDARYRFSKKRCYVETVNFGMYRKSVVDSVPPLNETIKRGEDWEYNYQIIKKYGKMIYSPEIKSLYFSRSNFGQLWKRQFNAGKYKLDIIRRYPGSILLRHLVPFIFVFFALFLPILTILGLHPFYCLTFYIIYFIANLLFSVTIFIMHGFKYLPYLIWSFFVMQFAYGLGFLVGLKYLFIKPK